MGSLTDRTFEKLNCIEYKEKTVNEPWNDMKGKGMQKMF